MKELLTHFMLTKIASVQANRNLSIQDQQRAVAIFLLVYLKYNLPIDQKSAYEIGWLLCLPTLSQKEFSSYWDAFLQPLQEEWYDFGLNG